jgi:arginyl-tRNA synthetase
MGAVFPKAEETDLTGLSQIAEIDLIKKLGDWPDEVVYAARSFAPHRITHYLRDLAALFHVFYDAGNNDAHLRVLSEDPADRNARLVLVSCTQTVLKNALSLLGLSAPEKM